MPRKSRQSRSVSRRASDPQATPDSEAEALMPPHRAQLLLCHEKIAGPHSRGGHVEPKEQFCSLSAYAWCFDCDRYVCDIHLSNHRDTHNYVVEYPKQTFMPGQQSRMAR